MGIKYGEFDLLEEAVNNMINTNALLILLNEKGFITSDEFTKAKKEAIEDFKLDFPTLFKIESI
ncbi:hypothetical protein [Bacillus paralicheniformis]|uniref:hypothetical protein n=1 Tax=Bacillus paralicheniformis TaxID=1648923 RepID=UPI002E1DDFDE|nr:hypothetical protein [Bacillus paralicheniformis]